MATVYEYARKATARGNVRQMLLFRQMKSAIGELAMLTVGGDLITVTLPEGRELNAKEKAALDDVVAAHDPPSDDTTSDKDPR